MSNVMVDKKRVLFLDVLRFFAIFSMAIIHTAEIILGFELISPNMNTEQVHLIGNIIYHIAPTIFMFAMGASINLTKRNNPQAFLSRGIKIFLISLVFNAVRGLLISVLYSITLDEFTSADFLFTVIGWTLGNDILMFAGLYFMIFGLISQAKNRDLVLAITSAVLYIASLFIPYGFETGYCLLDDWLGNFILVGESYFPVVTWSIIPTIGYFIFKLYLKEENHDMFMVRLGICALALFTVSLGLICLTGTYDSRFLLWGEGMFYFDLPTLILTLSLNYVYIPVIYFISKVVDKTETLRKLIIFESGNLTKIYLVHWLVVIISGIIFSLTGIEASSPLFIVLFGLFVVALSSLVVAALQKRHCSRTIRV